MVFNLKYIILATLCVVALSQSLPPCLLQCSEAAIKYASNKTCTSFSDPCICNDLGFQLADAACLKSNCTVADAVADAQFNSALCGTGNTASTGISITSTSSTASAPSLTSASSTTSASSMTSMSGSTSSMAMATSVSSTGTGSGSAASPTKSNGANAQAEFGLFTLGVAVAGAVVGGLL